MGRVIHEAERVSVEVEYDGNYRVVTRAGIYGNGWGVGEPFPTERGAMAVAYAIELAYADKVA